MGDPGRWPRMVLVFLIVWGIGAALSYGIIADAAAGGTALDGEELGHFVIIPVLIILATVFGFFSGVGTAITEFKAWRELHSTPSDCPVCGFAYAERDWRKRSGQFWEHECSMTATIRDTGKSLQGVILDQAGQVVWSCGHAHSNQKFRPFGGEEFYRSDGAAKGDARMHLSLVRRGIAPIPSGVPERGPILGLDDRSWEQMKHHYDYRCYYCGTATDNLHKEHYIPLAREGANAVGNIVPACQTCNLSKHTMTGDAFIKQLGRRSWGDRPERWMPSHSTALRSGVVPVPGFPASQQARILDDQINTATPEDSDIGLASVPAEIVDEEAHPPKSPHPAGWCPEREATILLGPDRSCPACGEQIPARRRGIARWLHGQS